MVGKIETTTIATTHIASSKTHTTLIVVKHGVGTKGTRAAGEYGTKQTMTLDRALENKSGREWWESAGAEVYPEKFGCYVNSRIPASG